MQKNVIHDHYTVFSAGVQIKRSFIKNNVMSSYILNFQNLKAGIERPQNWRDFLFKKNHPEMTSREFRLSFFRLTMSPNHELRDPDFCANRGSTCFCKPFDKTRKSSDRSNLEIRIFDSESSAPPLVTTTSSTPSSHKKVLQTIVINFLTSTQMKFYHIRTILVT